MSLNNNLKLVLVGVVFSVATMRGQGIVKSFSANTVSNGTRQELKKKYGTNKRIPTVYETQILLALSYFPELKNTTI